MSGYRVDLDAIDAAARVLRATVDSVAGAAEHLDTGVCASLGPGRLGTVAAALTEDVRRDLDRVLTMVGEDAELTRAAGRGYADHDQETADLLTRRASGQA